LEGSRQLVLITLEADVAHEQCICGVAGLITVCLSARLYPILLIGIVAGCCEVDVDVATVKVRTLLLGMSFGSIRRVCKLNVSKPV
jgi:hypothetical protein